MSDFDLWACRAPDDSHVVARLWVQRLEGIRLSPRELERVTDFEDCADTLEAWPVYAAALEVAHGRASFTAVGWQQLQYYLLAMSGTGTEPDDGPAAQLIEPIRQSLSSSRAVGLFAAEWISVAANDAAPWAGAVLARALAVRVGLPWGRHLDALRAEWEGSRSLPLPMQVPQFFGDPSVPRNVLATLNPYAAIAVSELPDLLPADKNRWEQWAVALRDVAVGVSSPFATHRPPVSSATGIRDANPVRALMLEGATMLRSMIGDRRGPTGLELQRAIDLTDATMCVGRWPIWGAIRRILTEELSAPTRAART